MSPKFHDICPYKIYIYLLIGGKYNQVFKPLSERGLKFNLSNSAKSVFSHNKDMEIWTILHCQIPSIRYVVQKIIIV